MSQPSPDPFTPPPAESPESPDSPSSPPTTPIITDVPEQLPDIDVPTIIPPDR